MGDYVVIAVCAQVLEDLPALVFELWKQFRVI